MDADGKFVSPGIIDTHTHYDAQPFWDKLCTPSIWHGVTTVLMGNLAYPMKTASPPWPIRKSATNCARHPCSANGADPRCRDALCSGGQFR
ncbi:hypothetical protein [Candidatus Entotheonella palauensis]|uniref:hypothetical protein n=1 Tax=Candidatus Entotheonella palauensis TaxID=93172 RepID=UPI002118A5AE|nr:hypothetical protein [Candidatus Entotheonella palauensis]